MNRDRPSSSILPVPGSRISDKYDVIRIVGEGGMGVVYEVVHTRLQQRAAIKMLQPRVQALPDVASRFEREARAACRLKSRHAVRITDVDHDAEGRAYMVMEFLEGHDLAEELHTRGRLRLTEAVDVVVQACVAMAEAHACGVVHRDLKPSNLFLVNEGGERIVKVLDFGISKLTTDGEAAVTSTFATMGTPLYMSPEQIRSTKNVDGRTDIWSLGVILFEALAGERPFQGTTTAAAAAIVADEPPLLRALVPDVPEGVEAAVAKALQKKPEDRFRDARSLVEALAPFGTNREALRAIDAFLGTAGPSGRPQVARPSSTPSFVHATTLAQATPPPQLGTRRSASGSTLPPPMQREVPAVPATQASGGERVAASVTPPVLSTEASWSSQRTSAGRAGKVTKMAVVGAVAAIAVFALVRIRASSTGPAPLPSAAASINVAPPVPSSPPSPPVIEPRTSPAAVIPSAAAPPSSTVATPPPARRPGSKPHGDRSRPVSSPSGPGASPPTAPPAAAPSPAPAATNPLHL